MAEKYTMSTVRRRPSRSLMSVFDDRVYTAEVIGITITNKQPEEGRFSGASAPVEEDQALVHLDTFPPSGRGAYTVGAEWQAQRRGLLEKADAAFMPCEWMQIKVRFLAMEVPTVRTAADSGDALPPGHQPPRVERGAAEVIASTWTFEGHLWLVGPGSMDQDKDISAGVRWRKSRSRNPDLVWRLLKVGA